MSHVRELSPWSARRALTEKMDQGQGNGPQPAPPPRQNPVPWTRDAPETQNGNARPPPRGARSPPRIPRESESDGSRIPKSRDAEPDRPRNSPRDHKSKHSSAKISLERDSSPEPYRKPRERENDRKRDRCRDGYSERSRDRRRHRSADRKRDSSRDTKRERSRDRRRDRSIDRRRERSTDTKRDRSRDRRRDRSRDRKRDRSRGDGQERRRDYSRDRDRRRHSIKDRKERRSRSPRSDPPPKRLKHTRSPSKSRSPSPHRRSKVPLPNQEISFRGTDNSALPPTKYGGAPATLEKPNFKTTGALAKAANKVEGTKISLKYHEPAEARKPSSRDQWKIVVFKGDDVADTIELHTRSCWLLGRSVEVVDYVLEHPSSSSQHAVIQFRYIQKTVEDEYGVKKQKGKVKPYIIDLESSNGTELNGKPIETSRYMELRDKDILQFAGSEREYVVVLPPPEKKKEEVT